MKFFDNILIFKLHIEVYSTMVPFFYSSKITEHDIMCRFNVVINGKISHHYI